MRLFVRNLIHLPERFLAGERRWGLIRLLVVLVVIILFARWDGYIWLEPGTTPDHLIFPVNWRYFIIPIAALLGAFLVGGNFVRKLYQLPRIGLALKYLGASIFSLRYPRLTIMDGKMQLESLEENLLDIIGGPGFLNIRSGSAVLLERLQGPSNVYSAGSRFISRWETIREIVNLADQHGRIDSVSATTKDRIEVDLLDINYRYRLRTGHRPKDYQRRTPADPYPFSTEAMRNMAYKRTVSREGLGSWEITVSRMVESTITSYVSQHQFDQLTAPLNSKKDTRAEIARDMEAKGLRDRLRDLGAELLWFDIGHIEPKRIEVTEQRVDTWGAKWEGLASIKRAGGESVHLANLEIGRAQGQADILKGIISALHDADPSGDVAQNLHNLIIMRTAQILEAMAEQAQSEGEETYPELPASSDASERKPLRKG